jgi:hypothetical protein
MEEPDDAYMDEEEDIEAAGGTKPVNQRTNSGSIKVAPEDSVAPADREDMREDVSDTHQEICTRFFLTMLFCIGGL